MGNQSAGILMYRIFEGNPQFLLVHPGGPFWAKKDDGAWSIPKGEFEEAEDPKHAAIREFSEELGMEVVGELEELMPQKLKSGKIVRAWAVEGDLDTETIISNTFEMEWPPKSGRKQTFPEIDKAAWFSPSIAKRKINQGLIGFLDELMKKHNFVETSKNFDDTSQPRLF